jgi:hypothetical protein
MFSELESGTFVDNVEFRKSVENLPESPMKQELLQATDDLANFDPNEALAVMNKWRTAAALRNDPHREELGKIKEYIDMRGQMKQADKNPEYLAGYYRAYPTSIPAVPYPSEPGAYRDYISRMVKEPKPKELNAGQSVMRMLLGKGLPLFNNYPGITAIKEAKTAIGRGSTPTATIEVDPATIDEIKEREGRFWEAGFAPKKAEGQPLWEAYRSWYVDKYGIEPGVKQ